MTSGLIAALEMFYAPGRHVELGQVLTFLYAANHHECKQKDILRKLRISQPKFRNYMALWEDRGGLGFIERCPDPSDQRGNILRLTSKGEAFLRQIETASAAGAQD